MPDEGPHLLLGSLRGGLYLGFRNKATQQVCAQAEKLITDFLASHPRALLASVDLRDCQWVDSTFAGWMIGVHKRMQRAGGVLRLTGCAPACLGSLEKMHLLKLFPVDPSEPPTQTHRVPCAAADVSDRQTVQLMLAAHEELARIDEENARVFGPIAEVLRKQLSEPE